MRDMRSSRFMRLGALPLLGLIALAGGATAQTRPSAAPVLRPGAVAGAAQFRGITFATPAKADLWLTDRKDMQVMLVGYGDGKVAYAEVETPGVPRGTIDVDTVARATFELNVDYGLLTQAERQRDWAAYYRLLAPVLLPMLPYLFVPENNAAEPTMSLVECMLKLAAKSEREAVDEEDKAKVLKQYEGIYNILQNLAKVDWSPLGGIATIKGSRCLLKLGKPKTAAFYLDEMMQPSQGDTAYGYYWLVRGLLAEYHGETRAAMDAAVLSVAFETKEIETFPDALLLSARCYEELQEWYRARDVYFEVASLFPNTDWADDAAVRLENILDGEHVKKPEEDLMIESVFFGVSEDINELGRKLLQDRKKGPSTGEAPRRRPPEE